jgi:SAM-dependent methyltransferase
MGFANAGRWLRNRIGGGSRTPAPEARVRSLFQWLLGRNPSEAELARFLRALADGTSSPRYLVAELVLSAECLREAVAAAPELHLLFIHHARLTMIRRLLPPARVIVDLGGANGSVYDMGYPHPFERITVIDLPPEGRHAMYRDIVVEERTTPNGPIGVMLRAMTDLSVFAPGSVDLVWSGESIEHITADEARQVLREALRVLRPGGLLCLDTPNRLLTRIHTADVGGGFIHPEHKIEWEPSALQAEILSAGFTIEETWGVCEMPSTVATGRFDYADFVLGAALTRDVDRAYLQYYACRTPTTSHLERSRKSG